MLRRALAPLAHRALPAAGPIGGRLRATAPRANRKLPLTPELLAGSLDASLRRLGTDYVDLFALHAATAEEVEGEDILHALGAILAAGKARSVAVAGDEAAAAAALRGFVPLVKGNGTPRASNAAASASTGSPARVASSNSAPTRSRRQRRARPLRGCPASQGHRTRRYQIVLPPSEGLGRVAVQARFRELGELGVGGLLLGERLLKDIGAIAPAEFARPGD